MFWLLIVSILSSVLMTGCCAGKVVKIVKEPANYGGMQSYQSHTPRAKPSLKAFRKEEQFSGPYHLQSLVGKCFSLTDKTYKYELCPFANITQHEQTWRWNAFQGVLGIWKEWLITNNTFEAMIMDDGDECSGHSRRKSKVLLKCANTDVLVSVKEPSTCAYEVVFNTPLACPLDAFLVYPSLSAKHQKEWEEVEEALFHGELTPQGYNKERKQLFVRAGLQVGKKEIPGKPMIQLGRQTNHVFHNVTELQTKEQCHEAYSKLLHEYTTLRQTVLNHNVSRTTSN